MTHADLAIALESIAQSGALTDGGNLVLRDAARVLDGQRLLWTRLTDEERARLLALPDALVMTLHRHWMTHGPDRLLPMPEPLAVKLGDEVSTTLKNALHAWLRNADDFEGP